MRCVLLLNSASGGNERNLCAADVGRIVEEKFHSKGHDISTKIISPEFLVDELKRAICSHPDMMIIGGGDGTISTAAKFLHGSEIAMGILPMGTFNLAARDLGVPLDIAAAAEYLASADKIPIDILMVAEHACLCTTVFGFYPEFSSYFEKRDHGGQWWKKAMKLITGLPAIFKRARPLILEWKGEISGRAKSKFSAFVPGRYRSTTGLVPARTDFQSGKFTGYIGTHKTSTAALKGLLDYLLGRHEENAELNIIQAQSLEINVAGKTSCNVMLDGEILRLSLPIRMEVLPKSLLVLADKSQILSSIA